MNCKPGELCRVVGMTTTPEANDHFVVTVKLVDAGYLFTDGSHLAEGSASPSWLVHGHNIPVRSTAGKLKHRNDRAIADRCLRPIRPGDISDEEVRDLYLPAPQKETA